MSSIPERVRFRLWGKAAGRCEYDGCNERLWLDTLTKSEFNVGYIAHIVADSADGPRGDKELSPLLAADLSNLMLACDRHHRLIDREQVAEHPADRLREMKRKHEERVELLSDLTEEKQSHVLLYGANVGEHSAPLSMKAAAQAMLPEWYPADARSLEIGLRNSAITDRNAEFWKWERINLETKVAQQLRPRLAQGEIRHLSVFAIAPQPLLILLGSFLSDIPTAEVYQRHREPAGWKWQESELQTHFIVEKPDQIVGPPALVISLSGTITDQRIRAVIPDASIWKVSLDVPHNDFLKSREQAVEFRSLVRRLMDQIKVRHGQTSNIHVFPAMPVALAVELGRVWMPKADLPMTIYDEDRLNGGFRLALTIGD